MELREKEWVYALTIIILLVLLTILCGVFYFNAVFSKFSATGYVVLKEGGTSKENATLQEDAKEDGFNMLKIFFKPKIDD